MAINIGLSSLAKSSVNAKCQMSPERLEVNDAIGESVRLYLRNVRLEFSVDDFNDFSKAIESSKENLELLFSDGDERGVGDNKLMFLMFLRTVYRKLRSLERFKFFAWMFSSLKTRVAKNGMPNKDGGLIELSRPYFDSIISDLSEVGNVIILRKFETLPFSVNGGDLDIYVDGELRAIKEVFDKYGFRATDQNGVDGQLSHVHFYKLDQHYDCCLNLVIDITKYINITPVQEFLANNIEKTKDGFFIFNKKAMFFHLVDSVASKYTEKLPQYYKKKLETISKLLSAEEKNDIHRFYSYASGSHKMKMIALHNKFTK